MRVERSAFYEPAEILKAVEDKVRQARRFGEPVDYLTFVPDGEPTLDLYLGREIELLSSLGVRIAVITNGSLIWGEDVKKDLLKANWVSLKIDSTREEVWRKIDRPYGTLRLPSILDGMLQFADDFEGELVTETMLVEGINDSADCVREIADFLTQLGPTTAYLSIPTRPPAEEWGRPPNEEVINRAYQILSQKVNQAELLIGYEGDAFAFTGDVEKDLLSITAVHPMREEAVRQFLTRAQAGWSTVQRLIAQDKLVKIKHETQTFYMRKLYKNLLSGDHCE